MENSWWLKSKLVDLFSPHFSSPLFSSLKNPWIDSLGSPPESHDRGIIKYLIEKSMNDFQKITLKNKKSYLTLILQLMATDLSLPRNGKSFLAPLKFEEISCEWTRNLNKKILSLVPFFGSHESWGSAIEAQASLFLKTKHCPILVMWKSLSVDSQKITKHLSDFGCESTFIEKQKSPPLLGNPIKVKSNFFAVKLSGDEKYVVLSISMLQSIQRLISCTQIAFSNFKDILLLFCAECLISYADFMFFQIQLQDGIVEESFSFLLAENDVDDENQKNLKALLDFIGLNSQCTCYPLHMEDFQSSLFIFENSNMIDDAIVKKSYISDLSTQNSWSMHSEYELKEHKVKGTLASALYGFVFRNNCEDFDEFTKMLGPKTFPSYSQIVEYIYFASFGSSLYESLSHLYSPGSYGNPEKPLISNLINAVFQKVSLMEQIFRLKRPSCSSLSNFQKEVIVNGAEYQHLLENLLHLVRIQPNYTIPWMSIMSGLSQIVFMEKRFSNNLRYAKKFNELTEIANYFEEQLDFIHEISRVVFLNSDVLKTLEMVWQEYSVECEKGTNFLIPHSFSKIEWKKIEKCADLADVTGHLIEVGYLVEALDAILYFSKEIFYGKFLWKPANEEPQYKSFACDVSEEVKILAALSLKYSNRHASIMEFELEKKDPGLGIFRHMHMFFDILSSFPVFSSFKSETMNFVLSWYRTLLFDYLQNQTHLFTDQQFFVSWKEAVIAAPDLQSLTGMILFSMLSIKAMDVAQNESAKKVDFILALMNACVDLTFFIRKRTRLSDEETNSPFYKALVEFLTDSFPKLFGNVKMQGAFVKTFLLPHADDEKQDFSFAHLLFTGLKEIFNPILQYPHYCLDEDLLDERDSFAKKQKYIPLGKACSSSFPDDSEIYIELGSKFLKFDNRSFSALCRFLFSRQKQKDLIMTYGDVFSVLKVLPGLELQAVNESNFLVCSATINDRKISLVIHDVHPSILLDPFMLNDFWLILDAYGLTLLSKTIIASQSENSSLLATEKCVIVVRWEQISKELASISASWTASEAFKYCGILNIEVQMASSIRKFFEERNYDSKNFLEYCFDSLESSRHHLKSFINWTWDIDSTINSDIHGSIIQYVELNFILHIIRRLFMKEWAENQAMGFISFLSHLGAIMEHQVKHALIKKSNGKETFLPIPRLIQFCKKNFSANYSAILTIYAKIKDEFGSFIDFSTFQARLLSTRALTGNEDDFYFRSSPFYDACKELVFNIAKEAPGNVKDSILSLADGFPAAYDSQVTIWDFVRRDCIFYDYFAAPSVLTPNIVFSMILPFCMERMRIAELPGKKETIAKLLNTLESFSAKKDFKILSGFNFDDFLSAAELEFADCIYFADSLQRLSLCDTLGCAETLERFLIAAVEAARIPMFANYPDKWHQLSASVRIISDLAFIKIASAPYVKSAISKQKSRVKLPEIKWSLDKEFKAKGMLRESEAISDSMQPMRLDQVVLNDIDLITDAFLFSPNGKVLCSMTQSQLFSLSKLFINLPCSFEDMENISDFIIENNNLVVSSHSLSFFSLKFKRKMHVVLVRNPLECSFHQNKADLSIMKSYLTARYGMTFSTVLFLRSNEIK